MKTHRKLIHVVPLENATAQPINHTSLTMITDKEVTIAPSQADMADVDSCPNGSSQTPPVKPKNRKRKNHRGGQKNKKKMASKIEQQNATIALEDDAVANTNGYILDESNKQHMPTTKKTKKRSKKVKSQPSPAREEVDISARGDKFQSPAQEQVTPATGKKNSAAVDDDHIVAHQPENAKSNGDLYVDEVAILIKPTKQETHGSVKGVSAFQNDTGSLNFPEQAGTNKETNIVKLQSHENQGTVEEISNTQDVTDNLNTSEQASTSATDGGLTISTAKGTAAAPKQHTPLVEMVVPASAMDKCEASVAVVEEDNVVIEAKSEVSANKDYVGSKAVKEDEENTGKDVAAIYAIEDVREAQKRDGTSTANDEAVIGAPEDTAIAATQEADKTTTENVNAEKDDGGDTTATLDACVANGYGEGPGTEDHVNGLSVAMKQRLKDLGVEESDDIAVPRIVNFEDMISRSRSISRSYNPKYPNNQALT